MRLTIIGCSGSMSGPQSSASSYLVQADGVDTDGALRTYSIVLDLGPGSMGQLLRHLDPAQLDAIAISHCHADHMVDLVGMHVYRRWLPTGALNVLVAVVAALAPPSSGSSRSRRLSTLKSEMRPNERSTPNASPFTYSTISGRLSCSPFTDTSSATAKSLLCGFFQSTSHTVCVCSPAAGAIFTP